MTGSAAAGGAGGGAAAGAGSSQPGVQSGGAGTTAGMLSDLIRTVNPHYGNPFFPQSRENCGSCAYAVYARLEGWSNVSATLDNIGTDGAMEMAIGKRCVYMSPEDIEAKLKAKGPGAHCIAGINRTNPITGQPISGHWFNLYYDGDKVYTVDGQSGEVFEFPHDYGYVSDWCALL